MKFEELRERCDRLEAELRAVKVGWVRRWGLPDTLCVLSTIPFDFDDEVLSAIDEEFVKLAVAGEYR